MWAQSEPATPATSRQYDIAPGALDQALSRFGRDAGIMIAIDPQLTAGLRSEGLRGQYTVAEGLSALLAGHQLEAVSGASGGYRLRRHETSSAAPVAEPGVAMLAEVKVSANGLREGTTEGTGSYTTDSTTTAMRLALSPRETPQSVSVITRQQMDDQGMTQLTDVVSQTPGLTFTQNGNLGSDSSTIYARGFAVENFQIDGVPQLNSNYGGLFQTADMAIYDRVEVVRGATGLMNGLGSPAATVNLVRKLPTQEFQASVMAEGGSWDYRRFGADVSSPLNQSGSVRGRFVAAYQENNASIERLHERREIVYGVVDADLTSRTVATLGFSYQNFYLTGHARSGLPLFFADGGQTDWARSKSAGADWAYSYRTNQTVFGSVEHRFDNQWRVKGTLSYERNTFDEVLGYAAGGFPDRATGAGVNLWASRWVGKPAQTTFDLYATGPFELLGRKHELVVGATIARTAYDAPNYGAWFFDGWDSSVPNIYTWDGKTPPAPDNQPVGTFDFTEQTSSAYATTRLRPTDALSVILGARVTTWKNKTINTGLDGASTVDDRSEHGKITPYAGVVYDFSKHWSAYASYTNIFKPQSNRDVSGAFLDPLVGNGFEVGAKGSFFDGLLNTSAAMYLVKQDNLAVAIPGVLAPDGSQAYYGASGAKTKGYELEVSGQLAPGWQATASFARNLSSDRDGKPLNTGIPQDTFKLFTTYRIAAIGNGLTVGGGLRWQSRIYSDDMGPASVRFTQGSYSVVDLMARYPITKKVAATFNLYNVFDKRYYTGTSSAFYGTPRSFRLGVVASF
ncbi:Ferric-pseudobactin BN7/BN8 receptor [compost metagenome]